MKKTLSLGIIALMLLTGGCCKNKEKEKEISTAYVEFDKNVTCSAEKTAEVKKEEEFDFEELDAEELAFLDDLDDELLDFEQEEELAYLSELEKDDEEEPSIEEVELVQIDEDKENTDHVEWKPERRKFAFKSLNFAFNSTRLEGQKDTLEENINIARAATEAGNTVIIQGHACEICEDDEINNRMSINRAQTIKNTMVTQGELPADQLEVVGYGKEMPLVFSNAEEKEELIEDLSPNRRVDFSITS